MLHGWLYYDIPANSGTLGGGLICSYMRVRLGSPPKASCLELIGHREEVIPEEAGPVWCNAAQVHRIGGMPVVETVVASTTTD